MRCASHLELQRCNIDVSLKEAPGADLKDGQLKELKERFEGRYQRDGHTPSSIGGANRYRRCVVEQKSGRPASASETTASTLHCIREIDIDSDEVVCRRWVFDKNFRGGRLIMIAAKQTADAVGFNDTGPPLDTASTWTIGSCDVLVTIKYLAPDGVAQKQGRIGTASAQTTEDAVAQAFPELYLFPLVKCVDYWYETTSTVFEDGFRRADTDSSGCLDSYEFWRFVNDVLAPDEREASDSGKEIDGYQLDPVTQGQAVTFTKDQTNVLFNTVAKSMEQRASLLDGVALSLGTLAKEEGRNLDLNPEIGELGDLPQEHVVGTVNIKSIGDFESRLHHRRQIASKSVEKETGLDLEKTRQKKKVILLPDIVNMCALFHDSGRIDPHGQELSARSDACLGFEEPDELDS